MKETCSRPIICFCRSRCRLTCVPWESWSPCRLSCDPSWSEPSTQALRRLEVDSPSSPLHI